MEYKKKKNYNRNIVDDLGKKLKKIRIKLNLAQTKLFDFLSLSLTSKIYTVQVIMPGNFHPKITRKVNINPS